MSRILGVQNLTARYDGRIAINDITFDVQQGGLLGIVGPNGAGKTTLFRTILGLHPYAGTIRLFGCTPKDAAPLMPLVGYVQQRVAIEPNFPATVSDVVLMGIIPEKRETRGAELALHHGCSRRRTYAESCDRIAAALETVGLARLAERRIGSLSGGELQRALIAKALIKDPLLLILDEPVTGVDIKSQTKFYRTIKRINEENGTTIIWSSHDLDAIEKYASTVACMNRSLFFHGEKSKFFADKDALRTYTESTMQMHMHDHSS